MSFASNDKLLQKQNGETNNGNVGEIPQPRDDRFILNRNVNDVQNAVDDAVRPSANAFVIPPDEDDDYDSYTLTNKSCEKKYDLPSNDVSRRVNGHERTFSPCTKVVSPFSLPTRKSTVATYMSLLDLPSNLPCLEVEGSSFDMFQRFSNASLRIGCTVLNKESSLVRKRIHELKDIDERLKSINSLEEDPRKQAIRSTSLQPPLEEKDSSIVPPPKRIKVAIVENKTTDEIPSIGETQLGQMKLTNESNTIESSSSMKIQRQLLSKSESNSLKEHYERERFKVQGQAIRMKHFAELLRLYQETGEMIAHAIDEITR